MTTLGIETSCDETSLCLYQNRTILSLKTYSQIELHKQYGGVVPEIASRDHLLKIQSLFNECLNDAKVSQCDIDLIAYTATPGLVGSLMTGIMFAKALSISIGVRAIPVNHLYAHVFTCNISHAISRNFACLLISGGHTFIYKVLDVYNIEILGQTIDDSIGELFDKVSKSIGLGYPGGVIVEKIAKFGSCDKYKFKIPLLGKDNFNFSFSGIKTEFLKIIQSIFEKYNVPRGTEVSFILKELVSGFGDNFHFSKEVANVCASLQSTVVEIITNRLMFCIKEYNLRGMDFVMCGGVASNKFIRRCIEELCLRNAMNFYVPPIELCTDNAAMVACVGDLMVMFNKSA